MSKSVVQEGSQPSPVTAPTHRRVHQAEPSLAAWPSLQCSLGRLLLSAPLFPHCCMAKATSVPCQTIWVNTSPAAPAILYKPPSSTALLLLHLSQGQVPFSCSSLLKYHTALRPVVLEAEGGSDLCSQAACKFVPECSNSRAFRGAEYIGYNSHLPLSQHGVFLHFTAASILPLMIQNLHAATAVALPLSAPSGLFC